MQKNKLLAVGLIVGMVAAVLAGCGDSASSGTPSSGEGNSSGAETVTSEAAAAPETAAETSPSSSGKKLVVGLAQSNNVTDYEDNYFTNYLEEHLGFELEFYMLPADAGECRTKVSLMATSKEDLPDVLVTNSLSAEMILQYGSSGFFLPLNEYLEDSSVMRNYNAIPDEDRETMNKMATMADGNIYGLVNYEPETWNRTTNRMFINKAWLDKLGLEVPTTTDELKDVLIAFRDSDPNGNGQKDEIGAYGYCYGYGTNITASLMNAFVFWNRGDQNGGLALDEDGKTVIAPFATEDWHDGLRYMNDLCNEGLLPANIFTDDDTQYRAILNQDPAVCGLIGAGSLSYWTDARTNANFLDMQLMEPLIGPKGIQYTPYTLYSAGQALFILSDTDQLDMALEFADLFYDQDVSIITRYGEEGVDWTRDPEILAAHTNAYADAGLVDGLQIVLLNDVWSQNQNKTWRNIGPRYASLERGNAVYDFSGGMEFDPEDPTQLYAKNYELYYPRHPEAILPILQYTESEAEAIQEQLTLIPDFVKQSLAEFVTGARDVETGWDTYLQELETMGLSRWLETAQAAYDRS